MVERVGELQVRPDPQPCGWCSVPVLTPPVRLSGAADPSARARAVTEAKAAAYRAHMLASHPNVLAVLG